MSEKTTVPLDTVVIADVQKDNFMLPDGHNQNDPVAVGQRYGMLAPMSALQRMQAQSGMLRISQSRFPRQECSFDVTGFESRARCGTPTRKDLRSAAVRPAAAGRSRPHWQSPVPTRSKQEVYTADGQRQKIPAEAGTPTGHVNTFLTG